MAGGRVASPGVFLATIGLLVATRISCGRQDTYVRISPGVGNGTPRDAGAGSSGGATTVGGGAGSTAVAPGISPMSGVGATAGDTPQTGGTGGEAIAPATVGAAGGSLAIGEPDGGGGGGTGGASVGAAPGSVSGSGSGSGSATSEGGDRGVGQGGNGGSVMTGTGPPRVIGIDFVGTATTPMDPSEVAGFKPAAHWNSAGAASGTLTSVTDQDGVVVPGVQVSWRSDAIYSQWTTDTPGNARMYNGYLDPLVYGVPATISISGLPAAAAEATFDVFLYAMGSIATSGEERESVYELTPTRRPLSQRGPSPPTPQSLPPFGKATNGGFGNYIQFAGVSVTSFTILATPGIGGLSRAPVNGIQIVLPPGS